MAYVKRKYLEGQKMEKKINTSAITVKGQSLDIMQLGEVLIESGYFQDAKQAAQAVVKVLAGAEIGLGPIASMTGIYIISRLSPGLPIFHFSIASIGVLHHFSSCSLPGAE